jgi:hypothetical protein
MKSSILQDLFGQFVNRYPRPDTATNVRVEEKCPLMKLKRDKHFTVSICIRRFMREIFFNFSLPLQAYWGLPIPFSVYI